MHGLSAADTLKATQSLYESKLVTYPRTDSRYLNNDMKPRIPQIMEQLKAQWAAEIEPLNLAKLRFTSRIIDDKKVTDHHALIPTGVQPRAIGENELRIYKMITTQFIAAFYPHCIKKITTVNGESCEIEFEAKGTQILKPGWTILFPKSGKKKDEDEDQLMPAFEKGESGPHEPVLREGKTKPPQHFTENSLLGAMEAAGKQVDDDVLREALKERGIGTPATRAAIIETLLQRNYIKRNKKQILATDMGRCLIALLQDPMLKSPEMTGEWEEKLKKIERSEIPASAFMENIANYTRSLIQNSSTSRVDTTRWGSCPRCGKEIMKGRRAYGCSAWKEGCTYILEPNYEGMELSPNQICTLLQLHILPQPVQIKDEPRLMVLSHLGQPMDIALPSAANQKKG